MSQAQAARELDVARTAYRLWELEVARPAPDRWRLISSWLGISVTAMLLADELISEAEAAASTLTAAKLGQSGRDWDGVGAGNQGDFFQQGRALVEAGVEAGSISEEQADALRVVLARLEAERQRAATVGWAPGELRKALPVAEQTPHAAREAVFLIAGDIPGDRLETARLLTSELVTNGVKYGPAAPASIDLFVRVAHDHVRVEVSDAADAPPQRRPPDKDGGYGLTLVDALATRWHSSRDGDRNLTWFELDLPTPGAGA